MGPRAGLDRCRKSRLYWGLNRGPSILSQVATPSCPVPIHWGVDVQVNSFLISARDIEEWLASRAGRITPRLTKRLRTGLHVLEKRWLSFSFWDFNAGQSQPIAWSPRQLQVHRNGPKVAMR